MPCRDLETSECFSHTLAPCDGSAEQLYAWEGAYPYSGEEAWLYSDATLSKRIGYINVNGNFEGLNLSSTTNGQLTTYLTVEDKTVGYVATSSSYRITTSLDDANYEEEDRIWHIHSSASLADLAPMLHSKP